MAFNKTDRREKSKTLLIMFISVATNIVLIKCTELESPEYDGRMGLTYHQRHKIKY